MADDGCLPIPPTQVHGGYALFEMVFWTNHAQVVAPWNEMLLLHAFLTLLTCVVSLMYPCRLTLIMLPLRQLLELATLADTARRFTAIYPGTPWHARFKAQVAGSSGGPLWLCESTRSMRGRLPPPACAHAPCH